MIRILYTSKISDGISTQYCFLESSINCRRSREFYSKEEVLVYIIGTLYRNGLIEFSELQDLCTRLIETKNKLPMCLKKENETDTVFLNRSLDIMNQLYEIKNFNKKTFKEIFCDKIILQVAKKLQTPDFYLLLKA